MSCINISSQEFKSLLAQTGKDSFELEMDIAFIQDARGDDYIPDLDNMKAPNGEPSKLFTDLVEQNNGDKTKAFDTYVRVHGKMFRDWFGDWINKPESASKVVDQNGEPLIVYHGSEYYGFESFEKEELGKKTGAQSAKKGFFFASNIEASRKYISAQFEDLYKKFFDQLNSIVYSDDDYAMEKIENIIEIEEYKKLKKRKYNDAFKAVMLDDLHKSKKISELEYRKEIDKLEAPYRKENNLKKLNSFTVINKYKDFILSVFPTDEYGIHYDRISGTRLVNMTPNEIIKSFKNKMESDSMYKEVLEELNKDIKTEQKAVDQLIYPLFLNIKNPLTKDFEFKSRKKIGTYADLLKSAKDENKDGAVFKNTFDPEATDVFIAFEPEQIKSINNTGEFDQTESNIYYDLDADGTMADTKFDAKLEGLLNASGITVSKQKVYAEGYEKRNGEPLSVAAKADLTNSLIQVDYEKAGNLTLAEEAMHFIVAANEGEYNFNRAMRLVDRTEEWNKYADSYRELYGKDDRKIRMEILGKVGARILKERINSPLVRYIKRMFDKVKSMLGSKSAELRVLLDKYASTFVESGIDTSGLEGVFYDADTTYVNKIRKLQEKLVKGLKSKLTFAQRRDYDYTRLQDAYDEIREAEYTEGMLKFISYMDEDTNGMYGYMKRVEAGKETHNYKKNIELHDAIKFYEESVTNINYFLNNEFSKNENYSKADRKKLKSVTKKIINRLNALEAFYRIQSKELTRAFSIAQVKDAVGDTDLAQKEIDLINKTINETDQDLNRAMYWAGSLVHASDPIVRSIHYSVVKSDTEVENFSYKLGREIFDKSEELGVKDMRPLMEKQDGKDTGYAIDKVRHGAWVKARTEKIKSLNKDYGLPTGDSFSDRELTRQIKHEWALAEKDVEKALSEGKKLSELDSDIVDMYKKRKAYNKALYEWFTRNTKTVDNVEAIIAEKKKVLTEEKFKQWYRSNTIELDNGGIGYRNELVEPSTGQMSDRRIGKYYVRTTDWTNPDFSNLSEAQIEMRDFLLNKLEEADTKHTKYRHKFKLPQVRATMVNTLKDKKFRNIKEQLAEEFRIAEDDTEYGETLTYADGTKAQFVPIYYVHDLENSDLISSDLLTTVTMYGRMAENFKQKASLEPMHRTVLEQLGNRKVKDQAGFQSEAYRAAQKFIDMNTYGMRKNQLIVGGVNLTKTFDKIKQYVTANNLVGNLFTTVAGYMTSSVYSKIEDLIGQYSNQKAKNKAEITFDKNIHRMMLELNKPNKTSKLGLFFDEHAITRDSQAIFKNLDMSRLSRAALNSGMYFQYELVKIRVRGKLALAFAHDLKYDTSEQKFFTTNELKKKGKSDAEIDSMKDYWQMHDVVNGKLVPRHNDPGIQNRLTRMIEYIGNNIEGELSSSDYAAAHQDAILQLVMTHRGWLVRNIQLRFKPKGVNYVTGQEEYGYYSAFFDFARTVFADKTKLAQLQHYINKWNELDNTERYAVKKTLWELAFVNAIATIAFILNGLADDDEDNWLKQYLAYQSNRVLLEVSALNPFPAVAVGPEGVRVRPPVVGAVNEIVEILNSPIAATRQLQDLQDIMYLFSSEEIERGPYEGMTKDERAIIKLGIGSKGYYQARSAESIRSVNQFIKNKALEWQE
jgi:hypothetical protein